LLGVQEPVSRWLNIELPKVQNRRVDLLGEIGQEQLLQIELQSSNVADMPLRMLEYGVGIWRIRGVFPRQILLYVGNDRMRMASGFQSAGIDYRYQLVDIRDLDGEAMLESDSTSDNILALLAGVQDTVTAIRRVLGKIARLQPGKREDAIRKLLLVSGMRGVGRLFQQETKKMPVDMDIMEHEILGPVIRKSMKDGALDLLRPMIEKRFGNLPTWVEQRLTDSSQSQLQDLALKFVDAKSLEELFA
jgi:hypothetical protein